MKIELVQTVTEATKFPMFGKGRTTGNPYIKLTEGGSWYKLDGRPALSVAPSVEALPAGTQALATQE